MKIFISSTVHELLDLRREIASLILEMGFSVVLSEDYDSDFSVECNSNSIESCLINLKKSDMAIFILDRRYGGNLKKAGYDNISATHLEYKTAISNKIPFYFWLFRNHSGNDQACRCLGVMSNPPRKNSAAILNVS